MNWEKYTSTFYIGNAVAQKLFLNLSTCFSISVVNAFIAKKNPNGNALFIQHIKIYYQTM